MPRVPGCCASAAPAVATTSMAARNKLFDRILTSWLGFISALRIRGCCRRGAKGSGYERGLRPELEIDQRIHDRLDLGEPGRDPRGHGFRDLVRVLLEHRQPGGLELERRSTSDLAVSAVIES